MFARFVEIPAMTLHIKETKRYGHTDRRENRIPYTGTQFAGVGV